MVVTVQALEPSAAAVLERPLTEDDFWLLPDNQNRYEIIGGELFVAPPPTVDHQNASQYLSVAMYHAVDVKRTGWVRAAPIGVRLSPEDIVQPDLIVMSSERSARPTGKLIADRPDLVVEILSPSNRRHDLVKKRAQYRTFGIPEYWIVDPSARSVEVFVLVEGEYVSTPHEHEFAVSQMFPAIEIDVEHLFSGEPFDPATRPSTTG